MTVAAASGGGGRNHLEGFGFDRLRLQGVLMVYGS
uniref:Uncharacterized protein n=1 Tax=Oryza sativa subsp. indica TaxID=39946 RepID=C5NNR7_ORYSI|nr:hypothetical protein [Oryza sativa Indica Group]